MQTTRPAGLPFFSYVKLFHELSAPGLSDLAGDYEASLLGPSWFQAVARFGLSLGGLPNWFGKRFDSRGRGVNLLRRPGTLTTVMPMEARMEASKLDGKPVICVHYAPGTRLPWPYVIDELRLWEGGTLLGMTLLDLPGVKRAPLPFLIHRV